MHIIKWRPRRRVLVWLLWCFSLPTVLCYVLRNIKSSHLISGSHDLSQVRGQEQTNMSSLNARMRDFFFPSSEIILTLLEKQIKWEKALKRWSVETYYVTVSSKSQIYFLWSISLDFKRHILHYWETFWSHSCRITAANSSSKILPIEMLILINIVIIIANIPYVPVGRGSNPTCIDAT